MISTARPTWSEADLLGLFQEYFGDRLTPAELRQLAADVAAALRDRRDQAQPPAPNARWRK